MKKEQIKNNLIIKMVYQFMIVFVLVSAISLMAYKDLLSGVESSTLMGSTIGYVLGKFL